MNQHHVAPVAVYGASGHTGTFVVAELRRRAIPVIAVGRDAARLPAGVPHRVAAIDDPDALDRALLGCALVINCAGPFLDTAAPVVEAALRTGCSYLDLTAEQASAQATFENYDRPARAVGIAIIPAAGFYGGLADLLASALVGEALESEITTAVALDRWWPTEGTRKTGERNRAPRLVVEDGRLAPMTSPAQNVVWSFDPPHGPQPMAEVPFSEVITISRHLSVRSLHSYLSVAALSDVSDAGTPTPQAIDADGRSAQRFAMEVVAVGPSGKRRAIARGQDIYAVSAPIVAEAAARIVAPAFQRRGALALGEAFDARDFLDALAPRHLTVNFERAPLPSGP